MLVFGYPLPVTKSGQSINAVTVKIQLSFKCFTTTERADFSGWLYINFNGIFLFPLLAKKGNVSDYCYPPQFSMFSQGGDYIQEANETCFGSL